MKTIKRALLSAVLLQAVCQPVNAAIDLEAARKTVYSMSIELKNRFLSQTAEITNVITSHPKIFGAACLSCIGLVALANYVYARGAAQSYNQIFERDAELLRNRALAKADFIQFINESTQQNTIDVTNAQNQNFYQYLNADAAFNLGILITTYNEKMTDECRRAIISFVEKYQN